MTDTLFVSNVNYKTLLGSTITASTMTISSITVSTMTASTIFSATGQTALGNNVSYPNRFVEVGSDTANSIYIDFHSSDAALPDYSTRIQSLGGATSGTGNLNMYASTIGLMPTVGVGIGTTVPQFKLDVYNANTIFTTAPTVHVGDGAIDNTGGYGMLQLTRLNSAADTKSHLAFIRQTTSVFGMGFYPSTSATSFGMVPGIYTGGMNTSNGMWFTPTGNVGIGSTLPTSLLNIYGPSQNTLLSDNYILNVTSASSFNGNGSTTVYSNSINLQAGDLTGMSSPSRGAQLYIGGGYSINSGINHGQIIMYTGATERMRVATNGNVGIGIANPGYKLDVSGNVNVGANDSTSGSRIYLNGTNACIQGGPSGSDLIHLVSGNGTKALSVAYGGNVGIGTTNPRDTLEAYGLIRSRGATGYDPGSGAYANSMYYWWTGSQYGWSVDNTSKYYVTPSSDYRIKENIQQPGQILRRLCGINMIDYEYKTEGIMKNDGKRLGLFAHELQDAFPEYPNIVIGAKDAVNSDGSIQIQSIAGEAIGYLVMKSVQELEASHTALQATVAALEARLAAAGL